MQLFCQWLIVLFLALNFVLMVRADYLGSSGKKPQGDKGLISTIIVISMIVAMFYGAGAFSLIIGT